MNNFITAIVLSILPVSEVRGGIPLAIASGYNPLISFLVLTIANILIIPLFFLFLDYINKYFMKIKFYSYIFNTWIMSTRKKIEHKIGTNTELLALFLFVAIPLPGTGAYSGVLIAWLFNLKRKKAILTIALGVLAASLIITLATLGLISLIK